LIRVTSRGSFKNFDAFAARMKRREQFRVLEKYGPIGVEALRSATPVDSAETRDSWYFEIAQRPGYFAIHWYNSHMAGGVPVAILLQYGHGTRQGTYIQGEDYINPALKNIFDQMANDMWKVVTQ